MRGSCTPGVAFVALLVLASLAGCVTPEAVPEPPLPVERERPAREDASPAGDDERLLEARPRGASEPPAALENLPPVVRLYGVTALEDEADLQSFVARATDPEGDENLLYTWGYEALSGDLAGTGWTGLGDRGPEITFRFPQAGLYNLSVEVTDVEGAAGNASLLLRVGKVPETERIPVEERWSGHQDVGGSPPFPQHGFETFFTGPADLTLALSWRSPLPGSAVTATVYSDLSGFAPIARTGTLSLLEIGQAHEVSFAAPEGRLLVVVEVQRGYDVSFDLELTGLADPVRPRVPYEPEDAEQGEHAHPEDAEHEH